MVVKGWVWIREAVTARARQVRLSYLPPLMVYLAAGVSSLTAIVGTFFVKEYLGLSAEFLAALGFWAGIPWTLKMPLGHVADLLWRWKSLFVYLGAGMIAASLAIMLALIDRNPHMTHHMSVEAWYVLSALLAPLGYALQDVVADAMTVEAVPAVDDNGTPYDPQTLKLMHTTMQTLGRAAIVGGGVLVSAVNVYMFSGVAGMTAADKAAVYSEIYAMAMVIPMTSVLGVIVAAVLKSRRVRRLRRLGLAGEALDGLIAPHGEKTPANWWILGGSLVFVLFSLSVGLSPVPFDQEIVFAGSMGIVLFLMAKLLQALTPADRRSLVGTAIIVFVFRALPGPGIGSTWWQIDRLGFDQQFLANLSLISSAFALFGMFVFRRFMAERSIAYVVGFLTIVGTLLSLPIIGLYYGLHHWTAALTGGVVDARFIAVVDTALESPLGQVAMIPMLAWIARSAPPQLKATYFAVMASFTNLALSLSSLGTKYLNQIYVVTRQVVDPSSGELKVPADYGQLGALLITATLLGLILPMVTLLTVQKSPLRSSS
jgi:hypothetical protein